MGFVELGPFVQSIVSLTKSLGKVLLSLIVHTHTIKYAHIFAEHNFSAKNCSSFAYNTFKILTTR